MVIYVDQSGLKDLEEIFAEENVTYQGRQTGSTRELNR